MTCVLKSFGFFFGPKIKKIIIKFKINLKKGVINGFRGFVYLTG